jgi:sugar lactone lactonase YvrE
MMIILKSGFCAKQKLKFYVLFLVLFFLFLCGCAGTQVVKDSGPVFFPPLPNPPRVQYLTSISSSRDVDQRKRGGFALLAVGDVKGDQVKPVAKPYGLAIRSTKLYVCDAGASRVIVIDFAARTFDYLKGDYSFGKLKKPINLTLDREGNLYVADTVRKEIVVYGPSGNYLRTIGRDQEMKPVDVAVDGDFLYVLDATHHEVKIFDRVSGKFLRGVGNHPETPLKSLSLPLGLALDSRGSIFTTNIGHGRVVNVDRDGHFLGAFGKLGDGFGQFSRPKGIAIDDHDRIYVVDAGHQNVQIFNHKGRLLMFFGDPGLPLGSMNLPAGIAVTNQHMEFFQQFIDPSFKVEQLIFVANQFGDHKIAVYGLGQMK